MVKIYKFNPEHKNYEGEMEARLDPIMGQPLLPSPHHISRTVIAPPAEEPGKIRCFDHDTQSWVQKENWLGKTVYRKDKASPVPIRKLRSSVYPTYGPLPDKYTGVVPPDKYHDWDEQSQSWIDAPDDRDHDVAQKAKTYEYINDTERSNVWDRIDSMSKAEFITWFDNQVTDLASAKVALRAIALEIAAIRRIRDSVNRRR